jgi:hypothetical protein
MVASLWQLLKTKKVQIPIQTCQNQMTKMKILTQTRKQAVQEETADLSIA